MGGPATTRFRYVTLAMITPEDMSRPIESDDAETAKAELYAMSTLGRHITSAPRSGSWGGGDVI